jgi:hypothetical protein
LCVFSKSIVGRDDCVDSDRLGFHVNAEASISRDNRIF